MANIDRGIKTDDNKIVEFVDSLTGGKFLILSCSPGGTSTFAKEDSSEDDVAYCFH
jgi:hypothetical protein